MSFYEFLKGIDFFGKEPEFYFKGRPKQVTHAGRIFTFIFIIMYIIIFCYKVFRMTQRVDITFYDSYSNTDEVPKIRITNDNFTLIFAVYDEHGEPFINDQIYYPEASFEDASFEDEESIDIGIERCNPNKLTDEIKEYFKDSIIENHYCLNDINFELQPYMNSLKVAIYPCQNNDEDEDYCEPKEVIDKYLNNHFFMVYFRDIILTPLNYDTPVKERINFLNTEIYKGLGQYLHTEMQLVKIETSTNIIGFDFLTEPRTEKYIKYDYEEVLPYPGYDLDDEGNTDYPAGIFKIQLNDKILLEKRYYIQLIDVLGEIGGLMEIIYSFFSVICSLIADIIYEKTITNDLFSFNMDKKLILIKKVNNLMFKYNKDIKDNNDKNIEDQNQNDTKIYSINNKNNKKKEKVMIVKTKKEKYKKSNIISEVKISDEKFESIKDVYKDINKNSSEPLSNITKNNKTDKENENNWIIENMTLKDIFISIFYCCKKKKRNVYKILVNESMNVVMEKLDIFNIFRNICSIEYSNYDINNNNFDIIKMSEECSKILSDIII